MRLRFLLPAFAAACRRVVSDGRDAASPVAQPPGGDLARERQVLRLEPLNLFNACPGVLREVEDVDLAV